MMPYTAKRSCHLALKVTFEMVLKVVGGVSFKGPILLANPAYSHLPDLVAQEGTSNANGEAYVGARGHSPNLATWGFKLGFANSIRSFSLWKEALEQTGGESSWRRWDTSSFAVQITVSTRWVRLS